PYCLPPVLHSFPTRRSSDLFFNKCFDVIQRLEFILVVDFGCSVKIFLKHIICIYRTGCVKLTGSRNISGYVKHRVNRSTTSCYRRNGVCTYCHTTKLKNVLGISRSFVSCSLYSPWLRR